MHFFPDEEHNVLERVAALLVLLMVAPALLRRAGGDKFGHLLEYFVPPPFLFVLEDSLVLKHEGEKLLLLLDAPLEMIHLHVGSRLATFDLLPFLPFEKAAVLQTRVDVLKVRDLEFGPVLLGLFCLFGCFAFTSAFLIHFIILIFNIPNLFS